jgi:Ca2+-binding EF-hand superfamily protein
MDTNGNGMLDPEEAQGPARFMLDRMARSNPKIDITKPIPMSVLTESFQQMRSGGPGSDGRGFGGSEEEIPILEKNTLVPSFTSPAKTEKTGVPGFGASGERFNVQIEEKDLKDADERIARYDRSGDKSLDENELKEGRWSDTPMQYDKNQDGKLSRQELAVRFARRRLAGGSQPDPKKEDATAKRAREARDMADKKVAPNPFEKRASYRLTDAEGKTPAPAGMPEWFTRNDINADNQVSMAEFSKRWSTEAIEDFARFDSNSDGFITSKECLVAVKKGYIPGAMSSSPSAATTVSVPGPANAAATPVSPPASGAPVSSSASSTDSDMKAWAAKKLKSSDKDGNGFLSPNEYSGDFAKVDTNKDGKIDVDEYAAARSKR